MALDGQELEAVEQALGQGEAFAALKARFPKLAFARCDASDVEETPYRALAGLDLHLIDATDHCVRITSDLAAASGVLIAKRPARS